MYLKTKGDANSFVTFCYIRIRFCFILHKNVPARPAIAVPITSRNAQRLAAGLFNTLSFTHTIALPLRAVYFLRIEKLVLQESLVLHLLIHSHICDLVTNIVSATLLWRGHTWTWGGAARAYSDASAMSFGCRAWAPWIFSICSLVYLLVSNISVWTKPGLIS